MGLGVFEAMKCMVSFGPLCTDKVASAQRRRCLSEECFYYHIEECFYYHIEKGCIQFKVLMWWLLMV